MQYLEGWWSAPRYRRNEARICKLMNKHVPSLPLLLPPEIHLMSSQASLHQVKWGFRDTSFASSSSPSSSSSPEPRPSSVVTRFSELSARIRSPGWCNVLAILILISLRQVSLFLADAPRVELASDWRVRWATSAHPGALFSPPPLQPRDKWRTARRNCESLYVMTWDCQPSESFASDSGLI